VGRRTRRTGGRGDTYFGQFKVTGAASGGENKVDISEGKVINGSAITGVSPKADLDISGGKLYISLEVWYDGGWQTDYLAGVDYPTQDKKTPGDFWTLRVLIASREDSDSSWRQQHFGEVHNTRVVSS
jgi:hypothetical protein